MPYGNSHQPTLLPARPNENYSKGLRKKYSWRKAPMAIWRDYTYGHRRGFNLTH